MLNKPGKKCGSFFRTEIVNTHICPQQPDAWGQRYMPASLYPHCVRIMSWVACPNFVTYPEIHQNGLETFLYFFLQKHTLACQQGVRCSADRKRFFASPLRKCSARQCCLAYGVVDTPILSTAASGQCNILFEHAQPGSTHEHKINSQLQV